jgi:hypothetical protein
MPPNTQAGIAWWCFSEKTFLEHRCGWMPAAESGKTDASFPGPHPMSFLLSAIAICIGIIVIQGTITMLAAWGITSRRPPLGGVIKAIFLSGIAYIIAAVLMAFQSKHLQGLGLPMPLVLLIVAAVPLLLSCWVFADCLDINMLQAFAINVLVGAIYIVLAFFSAPYLPPLQNGLPKTQLTHTPLQAVTVATHV